MNKKISADEFRESLDRYASDLKANLLLAQSIIASEAEGEGKMKRKWIKSLVLALAMILTLGTVAYGVTSMFRIVNWQGEVTSTVAPEEPQGVSENEEPLIGSLLRYKDTVPDDEMVRAWFDSEDYPNGENSTDKQAEKHFRCAEDFLDYMSGVTTLTAPARFPEGEYEYFDAVVTLVCKDTGKLEVVASGDAGPIHYIRYRMDEADALPLQYNVNIGMKDGRNYSIQSLLWYEELPDATGLNEGETVEQAEARGMDGALLIRNHKNDSDRDVVMGRKLKEPVACKGLISLDPYEEATMKFYEERIWIWGFGNYDPAELLKMFNGD